MKIIRTGAFFFSVALGLSSCDGIPEVDPIVDESVLYGSYQFATCPPLIFRQGALQFGAVSIPVGYERVKQSNRLVSNLSVRFIEEDGECFLRSRPRPAYFQFEFYEDDIYIKISSDDRKRYRLFKKSGKHVGGSSGD